MTDQLDLDGLEQIANDAAKESWVSTVSGPDIGPGDVMVVVSDGADWSSVAMHVHAFRPAAILALISQAREAERMRGWEARYMEIYQRLSAMSDRWDQAVFEHNLEPMVGEDFHQTENRRVLFECRPLADFEQALAPATGGGK